MSDSLFSFGMCLVLACVQQYCRMARLVLACVQQYCRTSGLVLA